MSATYVSAELRRIVARRAGLLCEYCLIAEADSFLGCAVGHIISEKHGGSTDASNLALACVYCNRAKGSDIGSIDLVDTKFTRFFHPRIDRWTNHFRLAGNEIEGITAIGRATVRILGFNEPGRVIERAELVEVGRYPGPSAFARMSGT